MMYRSAALFALLATQVGAEAPSIDAVDLTGTRVSVTIAHPDTGWDHYADGWRIETEDGTILGVRELLHPHVEEQPFTRSLTVTDLPDGALFIRVKCSVDGWSETVVPLSR